MKTTTTARLSWQRRRLFLYDCRCYKYDLPDERLLSGKKLHSLVKNHSAKLTYAQNVQRYFTGYSIKKIGLSM